MENRSLQRRLLEYKVALARLIREHGLHVESTSCGGYIVDDYGVHVERIDYDPNMKRYK